MDNFDEMSVLACWYEIRNTYDEWHSGVSYRNTDFSLTVKAMKNYEDWYCHKGSGTIYQCSMVEDIATHEVTMKEREIAWSNGCNGLMRRNEKWKGYTGK